MNIYIKNTTKLLLKSKTHPVSWLESAQFRQQRMGRRNSSYVAAMKDAYT